LNGKSTEKGKINFYCKKGRLQWGSRKKQVQLYITRENALLYLQITLEDFRNLCILKGIYPVEPKKGRGKKGFDSAKTYYLSKDIRYLNHGK
jgi:pescadillo